MTIKSLPAEMAVLHPPVDLFDRVLYTRAVISTDLHPDCHDKEWEFFNLLDIEGILKDFPPEEMIFIKALLTKRKALVIKHRLGKPALMCYVPYTIKVQDAWNARELIREPSS